MFFNSSVNYKVRYAWKIVLVGFGNDVAACSGCMSSCGLRLAVISPTKKKKV